MSTKRGGRLGIWILLGAILGVFGLTTARAEEMEFAIQSFDQSGSLTFAELPPNAGYARYRVEWAPSAGGPWTNFDAARGTLDWIRATGSNSITCVVPMCYRVVATVIDLHGMAVIPAGTNAGTDPDGNAYSNSIPWEFLMDKYEVTKALWDEVYTWSTSNGYAYNNAGSGKATDHPVHSITWHDAVRWCNARSQKDGFEPVYYADAALTQVYKTGTAEPYRKSAVGYRLPTPNEWEYAARGGKVGHRFPWDDAETISHARANYNASDTSKTWDLSAGVGYHPTYNTGGQPYTSPVGSFAPNAYGLYDMVGNVGEHCQSERIIVMGYDLGHSKAAFSWAEAPMALWTASGKTTGIPSWNGVRCIRCLHVE